jgi:hypothetical protein
LPLLRHRGVRFQYGGQEKVGDGVNPDARIEFRRHFLNLARKQVREAYAAADLCGDR